MAGGEAAGNVCVELLLLNFLGWGCVEIILEGRRTHRDSPELQPLCLITQEEHSRLFSPSVGNVEFHPLLLPGRAEEVLFVFMEIRGEGRQLEVVPVLGESHPQCLQFLWKQHVSTAPTSTCSRSY